MTCSTWFIIVNWIIIQIFCRIIFFKIGIFYLIHWTLVRYKLLESYNKILELSNISSVCTIIRFEIQSTQSIDSQYFFSSSALQNKSHVNSKIGWSKCQIVIVNNPSKWILYHTAKLGHNAYNTLAHNVCIKHRHIFIFTNVSRKAHTHTCARALCNFIFKQYSTELWYSVILTLLQAQSFTSSPIPTRPSFCSVVRLVCRVLPTIVWLL